MMVRSILAHFFVLCGMGECAEWYFSVCESCHSTQGRFDLFKRYFVVEIHCRLMAKGGCVHFVVHNESL